MSTKANWQNLFHDFTPWNKIFGIGSTWFYHAIPYTVYGWMRYFPCWLKALLPWFQWGPFISQACLKSVNGSLSSWVARAACSPDSPSVGPPYLLGMTWPSSNWSEVMGLCSISLTLSYRHYFLPLVQVRQKPHTFKTPAKFPSSAPVSLNDLPPLSSLWFYLFLFIPVMFPFSLFHPPILDSSR